MTLAPPLALMEWNRWSRTICPAPPPLLPVDRAESGNCPLEYPINRSLQASLPAKLGRWKWQLRLLIHLQTCLTSKTQIGRPQNLSTKQKHLLSLLNELSTQGV
ncbi:unnamed protein product [Ixodes pacificus]